MARYRQAISTVTERDPSFVFIIIITFKPVQTYLIGWTDKGSLNICETCVYSYFHMTEELAEDHPLRYTDHLNTVKNRWRA